MPKQLLVRNVPENVHKWIDEERQRDRMSQQEFVLSVLQKASSLTPQTLPLPFEQIRKDETVPRDLPFTFIDLFAGIGGFRLALDAVGGRSVFSSEWDKYSQKTYKAWFGGTPEVTSAKSSQRTFPTTTFSRLDFHANRSQLRASPRRKVWVRAHGFKCATQGTRCSSTSLRFSKSSDRQWLCSKT